MLNHLQPEKQMVDWVPLGPARQTTTNPNKEKNGKSSSLQRV
jgi:hypothetical protein